MEKKRKDGKIATIKHHSLEQTEELWIFVFSELHPFLVIVQDWWDTIITVHSSCC
jgi:hypothetical protein